MFHFCFRVKRRVEEKAGKYMEEGKDRILKKIAHG